MADYNYTEIPKWQMQMMEERLEAIEKNPDLIEDISGLFEELDRNLDNQEKRKG